ncbi:MAG: hypothetical protein ACOYOE_13980 [Chlorobium sp.]
MSSHGNYLDDVNTVMKNKEQLIIRSSTISALCIILAACGTPRESLQPERVFPANYRGASSVASAPADSVIAQLPYRTFFADETLCALIDSAVANNNTTKSSHPSQWRHGQPCHHSNCPCRSCRPWVLMRIPLTAKQKKKIFVFVFVCLCVRFNQHASPASR